jgi:ribosomal protein S18 acetylase RimI-like enzyme
MTGKPIEIPSMCGTVLRKPQSEPDDVSIALFGPGVPAIATAKAAAEVSQARLATASGSGGNTTPDIMADMEIRPARRTDARGLAEQVRLVAEEGRWIGTQSNRSVEELEERFRSTIEENAIMLVLEHDRRIVGGIGIHPTGIDGVHSLGMSILEEFRGQGWGRQLVDGALREARERRIVKVVLEVFPENGPAIALYASSGFEVEGYKRHHYPRLDGTRRSAVMMALFL